MTPPQMTALVEAYFDAVDRMHLADTLALFVPDAQFHIPTHGLHFRGRDGEIAGMYERLFARYAQVWHGDFVHVVQAPQPVSGGKHRSPRRALDQAQLQLFSFAWRPVRGRERLHGG